MIWAPVRRALAWLAAGILAVGGAWLAGRRNGAVRAAGEAAREDLKDMETAQEVRNATDAKSDAAVRGDLAKWVRPE